MTFLSCFIKCPIWNPHFGGQEVFLVVTQKHLKLFAVPSARKTPLTLEEAISLPEQHLPSCRMIFPYVNAKYSTMSNRGLLFQAFVLLTSSKHTNPHTGWQKPQSDCKEFTSCQQKLIHVLPRNTLAHTGYTQRLLSIPYSVKLLPSLQ
jgi:hypothetical protein